MSNIREVKFERSSPEPNQEVVSILERWLECAKKGEIIGIALAGAKPDGGQVTEFNSGVNCSLRLQSAITTLFFRYGCWINED